MFCWVKHSTLQSEPRDGRWIPGEAKAKNIFALQRFVARGGGNFAKGPDSTLADVGLEDMMPAHYSRRETRNQTKYSCSGMTAVGEMQDHMRLHLPLHLEEQGCPE